MKASVNFNSFNKSMQGLEKVAETVFDDAYDFFKKTTPIGKPSTWKSKPPVGYKPGNARRNTRKDHITKTITGDYAYSERLDEGYSKQAPDGMIQPTIEHIEKRLNQLVRGL